MRRIALATTGMMLMMLSFASASEAAPTFTCAATATVTLNSATSTTILVTGGNVVTIDGGTPEPACGPMQSLLITGDAAANNVSYSGVVAVSVTANLGDDADVFTASGTQAVEVFGGAGADTLTGADGSDTLHGEGDGDTLNGGLGDDLLLPGTGTGSATGGGNGGPGDTVSYSDVPASGPPTVVADLAGPATVAGDAQTLSGVENLTGSPGDDVLVGDAAKNDLNGLGGDDLLRPGTGTGTSTGGSSGPAGDTVSFQDVPAGPPPTVTASVSGPATVAGSAQTLAGVENLKGSPGDDVLIGDANKNDLDGDAGDDLLRPGEGPGTNTGGSSGPAGDTVSFQDVTPVAPPAVTVTADVATSATLAGGPQTLVGVENLRGSSGNDVLIGDANKNDLDGGAGDDVLRPGKGAGTSTGGANGPLGDTVSFQDVIALAPPLVTVTANVSGAATVSGDAQSLAGVENLTGSPGDDELIGDAGNNDLDGAGGDDVLRPGTGNGTNTGGASGPAGDTVSFQDIAAVPPPAVTVTANVAGPATMPGGAQTLTGIENLRGSPGNDVLIGDANKNDLDGAAGDDVLRPGAGLGTSTGGPSGPAGDTVSFQDVPGLAAPAVTVTADVAGSATVVADAQTLVGIENLRGSPGNDVLIGDTGKNDLDGGAGDDVLRPGVGLGTNTGGADSDTVSFQDVSPLAAPAVTVTANVSGAATVSGDAQTLVSVENLTGSAGNDVLIGDAGKNDLDGAAGDDVLRPAVGLGTNTGGADVDTVSYQDVPALPAPAVTLTASLLGPATVSGDAQTISSVENLVGSAGNDVLIGDAGKNDLDGAAGDDVLRPGAGLGTSTGGADSDTVSFEDVTALAAPAVTVTADVAGSATVSGDAQTLVSIENLTGSPGNDVLIGDAAKNDLDGGAGDDVLRPGVGLGTNTGGTSGAVGDTVSFQDVTALPAPAITVTANVSGAATVSGDAQTLTGVENLLGSAGNDVLIGDAGKNDLDGAAGDDVLRPGAGLGSSTGGANGAVGDTVSFEDVTALGAPAVTVTASLAGGTATVSGDAQTLATVENLTGSAGNDTLTGDGAKNVVRGEAGDDVLDGGGDDDLLVPATGSGSSTGGGGTDTVTYADIAPLASPAITMTVDLAAGTATGPGVTQTLSDVDNVTTGAGDDVLTGDAQSNRLDGAGGTDTVSYHDRVSGQDVVASLTTGTGGQTATGEADVYVAIENLGGGAGADTLTGDGAQNELRGGAGDDTLDGLGGADVLLPGSGAGSTAGGPGTDVVSFADIPPAAAPAITVRANLDSGSAVVLGVTQSLATIENVTGSAGADVLIGDAANNVLDGAAGIDTISYEDRVGGENVVASLATESGGQTSTGEADTYDNAENLTGGGGNDTLTGDSGPNVIHGNAGTDTLNGGDDADVLYGDAGTDTLNGGDGADLLEPGTGAGSSSGGPGVDTLSFADVPGDPPPSTTVFVNLASGAALVLGVGQTMDTTIENVAGSAGNDVITGDTANNVLDGGAGGTDLVWYADRTAGHDVVASLASNTGGEPGIGETDTYAGIEDLQGGLGDDTLTGNAANNVLNGSSGTDTVSYADRVFGQNVVASLATNSGGQTGTGESDSYLSIENLTGGAGNDTLTGSGSSNKLTGGPGSDTASYADRGPGQDIVASLATNTGGQTSTPESDTYATIENLTGGGGNDTLSGDHANNVLDGAAGTDTVTYADRIAGEHVVASLAAGSGGQPSAGETDTYLNAENLRGGAGNDTLSGNGLANILSGGLGDDTLDGGPGADVLSGESGTDTASYAANSPAQPVDVTLDGQANDGIGGAAEGDNVVGTENVTGGDGPDRLTGNQAVNDLRGGAGDDTILGKGGSDALDGGPGTDTVSYEDRGPGEGVSATLAGAGGGAGELDSLSGFERLVGGAGDDSLTGSAGDDEIRGGPGADVIAGSDGNDTLRGEDGPDTLSGGAGGDWLDGGAGNDRLDGGAQPDGFSGGPGDDDISAYDGNAEDVSCGDGNDRVDHDLSDRFNAGDCESRVVLGFVPPPFTLDPRQRDRDRDGSFAGTDCNDLDPTIRPGGPDIPGDGIDQNCNGSDAPFPPITTDYRLHSEKAKTGRRITLFELRRVPAGAKIVVTCKSKKFPKCVFASRSATLKGQRAKYSIRGYFGDRPLSNGSTILVRVSAQKSLGRTITVAIRKPGQIPTVTLGCLALDAKTAVPCA